MSQVKQIKAAIGKDTTFTILATATNLSVALTNAAQTQSISETHNGGWSASASAEGLSVDYNITTTIAATGQPGTTIVNAWTAAFTPDVGQSLFMGHALPPGLLTASELATFNSIGPQTLSRSLDQRPPAAIVVGGGGALDAALRRYAIAHGYRREMSPFGKFELDIPVS